MRPSISGIHFSWLPKEMFCCQLILLSFIYNEVIFRLMFLANMDRAQDVKKRKGRTRWLQRSGEQDQKGWIVFCEKPFRTQLEWR